MDGRDWGDVAVQRAAKSSLQLFLKSTAYQLQHENAKRRDYKELNLSLLLVQE